MSQGRHEIIRTDLVAILMGEESSSGRGKTIDHAWVFARGVSIITKSQIMVGISILNLQMQRNCLYLCSLQN